MRNGTLEQTETKVMLEEVLAYERGGPVQEEAQTEVADEESEVLSEDKERFAHELATRLITDGRGYMQKYVTFKTFRPALAKLILKHMD